MKSFIVYISLIAFTLAQSCTQNTVFNLQTQNIPDLALLLQPDGTLFNATADGKPDQRFILCDESFPTFLSLQSVDFCKSQDRKGKTTTVNDCTNFNLTQSGGNVFLGCHDFHLGTDVVINGFTNATGLIVGNPGDALSAGQNPVSLKAVSDPCSLFKPAPTTTAAPPAAATTTQAQVTTANTPASPPPATTPPSPPPAAKCDPKTGKGCQVGDCKTDSDCPDGTTCQAPQESGDLSVCFPADSTLANERKLLSISDIPEYTESNLQSQDGLNQFAIFDLSVKFAFATYSDITEISDGICGTYKRVAHFESFPLFISFGIYQKDDHVVLAFRGTVNDSRGISNWLVNLNIFSTEFFGRGVVALGFLTAYQSVDHQMKNELNKLKFTNLTITGHSLGGALSQMALVDLLSSPHAPKITSHVTFGAPRVGDINFQKQYEDVAQQNGITTAHFVAKSQSPKLRVDFITELAPIFEPVNNKQLIAVPKFGYISLHNGYGIPFKTFEQKFATSKGKCVDFDGLKDIAPTPAPSAGPTSAPPPGPSPSPGTTPSPPAAACNLDLPSSSDPTDLTLNDAQIATALQDTLKQFKACAKNNTLQKRAPNLFCNLTPQQMTDQIRQDIKDASLPLGYSDSDLQNLNDQQLIQHNQENNDLNNFVLTLNQKDVPLFMKAYHSVHEKGFGDADATVAFQTIQTKANQKIRDANQIVSSIGQNQRVTIKTLQPDFIILFPSSFLTDIVSQLPSLQTQVQTDPVTKKQVQVTFLNPTGAGNQQGKIMSLFLSARNALFTALNNLNNPRFQLPNQKLFDLSHPEVKAELNRILSDMTVPGTEHVYLYIDTSGRLTQSKVNGLAIFDTQKTSVIVLNQAYMNDPKVTDESKVQTLVHELSHSLAGTVDHAYGAACSTLFPFTGSIATYKATQNADSVAFFVMAMAEDPNKSCHVAITIN